MALFALGDDGATVLETYGTTVDALRDLTGLDLADGTAGPAPTQEN
jgi:hypothetical protein